MTEEKQKTEESASLVTSSGSSRTDSKPSRALVAVAHGQAVSLYLDVDDGMGDYIGSIGETDAFAEAHEWDMSPGVWVAELTFVDDGPGDWPGTREARLQVSTLRSPTAEEWQAHVSDEEIWWTPSDSRDGTGETP